MIARNLLVLALAVAVFWLAAKFLLPVGDTAGPRPAAMEVSPAPIAPQQQPAAHLLADISLHSVEELELLFDRVEQLLERPLSEGEQPLVSLVLHGQEVEFFALKNYDTYKNVVDRAAKLAALGAVEISICRTQMKNFGIAPDEVPSFLRQVPYGPGEVERLLDEGFVYM
jgi:intracellular sulfur oxidation DsrE/DsrF family protein